MAWGRLDADAPSHPKFIQAGPLAFALFCAGICYANKYRTDGSIPAKAIYTILPGMRPAACMTAAVALQEAGLWEVRGDGYQIHDFLKYNLSADEQREQDRLNHERSVAGGRARSQTATRIRGRYVSQPTSQPIDQPTAGQKLVQFPPASTSLRNEDVDVTKKNLTALSGAPDERRHKANGFSPESKDVLAWLNTKAGKNFRPVAANLSLIDARLKDGITAPQLKAIVSRKVRDWLGTEQAKYLRPETLFNRTKAEQYVGELPPVGAPDGE